MQLFGLHQVFASLRPIVKARQAEGNYQILEADLVELANVPLREPVSGIDELPTDSQQMLAFLGKGIDNLVSVWTRSRTVQINRDAREQSKRVRLASRHVETGRPGASDSTRQGGDQSFSGLSTSALSPLEEHKVYRSNKPLQRMPPPATLPQRLKSGPIHDRAGQTSADASRPRSPASSITSFAQTRYSEQPFQSSKASTPSFPRSEIGDTVPNSGEEGRLQPPGQEYETEGLKSVDDTINEYIESLPSSRRDFSSRRDIR